MRPVGIRASSAPPPLTTSKRSTFFVPADSPSTFCSTISDPGLKPRKSSRNSCRSAGWMSDVVRDTGPLEQAAVGRDLQHRAAVAELEVYERALDAFRNRTR